MLIETVCKTALITVFSAFSIIRIMYYLKTKRAGYRTVIEERKRYSIWLSILICYQVFTLFLHLRAPQTLAWAAVSLPVWSRISGILLGMAALISFIWVHQALGNNHSAGLKIKDMQVLVTDGPYRWIRHPMYSAFYLLHVAAFLLTANWFIGVTWLAGLTIIIRLRVRREEEMLLDRFGPEYFSYMERTGRFVPPMKLVRPRTGQAQGNAESK